MSRMLPINKVVESVSITHKFDKPVLKFLNTSDVENGKIVNINNLQIQDLKGQAKKTIKKHDILFSEIRPKNRRFAYVDIDDTYDFVVSTKLMVLRNINSEVDNKYFYYFLTNDHMLSILQDRAENRIGSFPQITFDLLSEYFIRVPHLSEQIKIASILSALDSKIELNNRINAELEAMAKTLYDYWFVQFEFPDSKGKPFKNNGGNMVWNEELKREIPEGWEVKNLQEIAKCIMGPSPKGESYNQNGIGTPLLNGPADYENGALKGRTFTTEPTRLCQKNDLVLCIRATIGNLVYSEQEFCLGRGVAAVRANDKRLSELIYFLLIQEIERFKVQATGSIIVGITKDDLIESKCLIAKDDIIHSFHSQIKPQFDKIRINKKENQKLIELRDWLLPMLMNGQVKVN